MTFKELQDATIFGRFKEGQRSYIKTWLNTRYARIWTAFEWAFRIVEPTTATTVAGNRYLGPTGAASVLPTDFGEVRDVFDDNGDPLDQLEERAFNQIYLPGRLQGSRGRPGSFTVVNRKIILGPVPDVVYSMSVSYKRLLCHDDGAGASVVGAMVANGDKPLWPEEHHEVLVVGAQALGLKLVNDPTWESLEQQHDDLVAGMLADGLLHDTLSAPRQYGRDTGV